VAIHQAISPIALTFFHPPPLYGQPISFHTTRETFAFRLLAIGDLYFVVSTLA
jgi:hypothetical protein